MNNNLLPITKQELNSRYRTPGTPTEIAADFICVTGDAYVDHPSFGIAIVSRLLESLGFKVGIIAQPVNDSDFTEFGAPKYAFMVSGGNIDSMVANYTVSGKKRHDDDYSPGGKGGKRPDYAVNTYCKTIKRLFADSGIVIGGLEASLRRFAHYDYWSDTVLQSILISSGADLLIYGMAELTLIQLAKRLEKEKLSDITDLKGTCVVVNPANTPVKAIQCDSYEIVSENKKCYAKACVIQHSEQDEIHGRTVVQRHGDVMLVQNPPQKSLSEPQMDRIYALAFTRQYHPVYEKAGGVPAIKEVEFSITWTRGCFGSCNFCSIALHQGRRIQTRSEESVIGEAQSFLEKEKDIPPSARRFKGYIHDVGGATANFGQPSCKNQLKHGLCRNRKCLTPAACKNLDVSHAKFLNILRRLRTIKGIKKVFVRSGIRYDYLRLDKNREFLRELVEFHVSGQLKVAPEHCKANVLACMGKPQIETYERFSDDFFAECKRAGKEQYLIAYLMSSHPGATLHDAVDLMLWLKKHRIRPEQVQDFYPTPATISTAMYYTGLDPFTLKPLYVAKSAGQKQMQRALLQYYKPENHALVEKAISITKGGKKANGKKHITEYRTNKSKGKHSKTSFKKKKR
jgi:uncharacterized radical SAM protein YgiQ